MENNPLPVKSRILYQSAACVVVNKLIGEAVEGASGGMVDLREAINKEQLAMSNEKLGK